MSEMSTPSVWDARQCELVPEEWGDAGGPLSGLFMGPRETSAEPGLHMAAEPAYVPYQSTGIVRHAAGEAMGRAAFRAVYCEEMAAASASSPLAASALGIAALLRSRLWSPGATPAARALAAVAPVVPRKGGEVDRMLREFYGRSAQSADLAKPMAMREFYSSIYAWMYLRVNDVRLHDLCGSALCLTTGVDYPGSPDDAGGNGSEDYIAAAGEGLACLGGRAAAQCLRDMVITDAFMVTKNAMIRESGAIDDLEGFLEARGGPPTPREFILARWWDAAVPAYYRLLLAAAGYQHVADELGTFTSMDRCGRVRRAFDSIIRYNEVVDLVSDFAGRESFNEVLVALAAAGGDGVSGYADALAAVIDDVLSCECGQGGHEEIAELAMGCCLWYVMIHRYLMTEQLVSLSAEPATRAAFARRSAADRLRAVATTALRPGYLLHAPDWAPLWDHATGDDADRWVPDLARRAARRCLTPGPRQTTARHACEAIAVAVLAGCETTDDAQALHALAGQWRALYDAATAEPACDHAACRDSRTELRGLVGRIWSFTVLADRGNAGDSGRETPVRLFTDTDRAIRRSYPLAPDCGLVLRRAFFGVASSAVELTGLGPYARLIEGIATMCRQDACHSA